MRKLFQAVAVALMLAPSAGVAQDFDAGLLAINSGDFATALRELKPLAEQGHAGAQFNLGLMYDNGEGVTQDYAEAVRWYRLSADQGDANAQNNLGLMYGDGNGVTQDYAEAVRWYRLSADQGDANAQNNLGLMYYEGQGVLQNYVSAYMWAHISAATGNESAKNGRDFVATQMTAEQIAEAQRRAKVCMASNYQDCD